MSGEAGSQYSRTSFAPTIVPTEVEPLFSRFRGTSHTTLLNR